MRLASDGGELLDRERDALEGARPTLLNASRTLVCLAHRILVKEVGEGVDDSLHHIGPLESRAHEVDGRQVSPRHRRHHVDRIPSARISTVELAVECALAKIHSVILSFVIQTFKGIRNTISLCFWPDAGRIERHTLTEET